MSGKRKKTKRAERAAFLALLTIWIYVIIHNSAEKGIPASSIPRDAGPVLIVDPGHGGMDGGAVSAGGLRESQVNLSVSLRLRELGRFFGLPVEMTREAESLEYPPDATTVAARKRWDTRNRVEMINGQKYAVLISVHQNYYPSAAPAGPQILYADTPGSRELADRLGNCFIERFESSRARITEPVPEDVYIMNHVTCPAILVECGFLSNPREAARLADDHYQLRLAAVMLQGFLLYTEDSTL